MNDALIESLLRIICDKNRQIHSLELQLETMTNDRDAEKAMKVTARSQLDEITRRYKNGTLTIVDINNSCDPKPLATIVETHNANMIKCWNVICPRHGNSGHLYSLHLAHQWAIKHGYRIS